MKRWSAGLMVASLAVAATELPAGGLVPQVLGDAVQAAEQSGVCGEFPVRSATWGDDGTLLVDCEDTATAFLGGGQALGLGLAGLAAAALLGAGDRGRGPPHTQGPRGPRGPRN